MFRRLTRGRDELHKDLTPAVFEETCRRRFARIRWQQIEGSGRRLYLMHKVR